MVGVRVLVGSQSIDRAPTYLEVFGRTTQVTFLNPIYDNEFFHLLGMVRGHRL